MKPTPEDIAYMGRVAELGCVLCRHLGYGFTPAVVHHLRTGQGRKRASHKNTMGLCPHHHQFSGQGVHDMGREEFEQLYRISELELLHIVQRQLGEPEWIPNNSQRNPRKKFVLLKGRQTFSAS